MDITINTQEENPAPAPSTILASSGRAQKPGQFPQRQHQNLPRRITDQNNVVTEITYDATGRKWLQQTTTDARIYAGAVVLTKENGTYSLEAANTSDGRLVYDAEAVEVYPEFYHKDHLGNVRVAFADRNKDLKIELLGPTSEITQQNDYYPFGLRQEGDSLVFHQELSSSRYLFNGIEHNEELGLDLAFYRSYDPAIGRWMQIDPQVEKYYSMSPYNGMGNNPVLISDPLGDTLSVGGNLKKASKDIYSLVDKKYHDRISIDGSSVGFNAEGLTEEELANDSGLALLVGLTSAKENYLYSVEKEATLKSRVTGELFTEDLSEGDQVSNSSGTRRLEPPGPGGALPGKEGVDGQVSIHPILQLYEKNSRGAYVKKNRASQVFHELQESYERTTNKQPYLTKDGRRGAHIIAIQKESKFHKKSHQPGTSTRIKD